MATNLATNLTRLAKSSVRVLDDNAYPEAGQASVVIAFADGTKLRASYWRMPAPIDAIEELRNELENRSVTGVILDKESGDLILRFRDELKLEVFNFTGYEIWQISFPDGTVQYSNYVLSD